MYRPVPSQEQELFQGEGPTAEQVAEALRLYLERGGGRSPVRMAQALRDAGYRFGPMPRPAKRVAGLALRNRSGRQAEGPQQEFFQSALPRATRLQGRRAGRRPGGGRAAHAANTFPNRRDLKTWLEKRVREAAKAAGVSLDTSKAEVQDYLVRVAVRDALYALTGNANAMGGRPGNWRGLAMRLRSPRARD